MRPLAHLPAPRNLLCCASASLKDPCAELCGTIAAQLTLSMPQSCSRGHVSQLSRLESPPAGLGRPEAERAAGARCRALDKGAFNDDEGVVPVIALAGPPQTSTLDMLLMAEWEERAEQGLFRYDVTACPCKVLPGPYGFVAQCNEGRASKKRPTEFRIDQARPAPPPQPHPPCQPAGPDQRGRRRRAARTSDRSRPRLLAAHGQLRR